MQYINRYQSPLGEILLACDDQGLTGLWFDHEKYYALNLDPEHMEKDTEIFRETRGLIHMNQWLYVMVNHRFYKCEVISSPTSVSSLSSLPPIEAVSVIPGFSASLFFVSSETSPTQARRKG